MGISEDIAARSPPGVFDALRRSSAGIAGCGGLGSNIAIMMARSGIGKLVLADFDCVELSNLNRQCFALSDVGKHKAEALREAIHSIDTDITIKTHDIVLDRGNIQEIFSECDIIFEALDNPESKSMILETVLSDMPGKPIICGNGMGGISDPSLMVTRRIAENAYVCGDGVSGTDCGLCAPRVCICAGLMANKAIQILTGRD